MRVACNCTSTKIEDIEKLCTLVMLLAGSIGEISRNTEDVLLLLMPLKSPLAEKMTPPKSSSGINPTDDAVQGSSFGQLQKESLADIESQLDDLQRVQASKRARHTQQEAPEESGCGHDCQCFEISSIAYCLSSIVCVNLNQPPNMDRLISNFTALMTG